MSSALPRGFLDINSALSRGNAEVHLMGVVTDFLPPSRSRGTDLIFTFSIADPSYGGNYDDGLRVRFFRPLASEMPAIRGTGDVVLLRSIKISEYHGMTIGLSNRVTSWVVFPAGSIPVKAPSSGTLQHKNVKGAWPPAFPRGSMLSVAAIPVIEVLSPSRLPRLKKQSEPQHLSMLHRPPHRPLHRPLHGGTNSPFSSTFILVHITIV